MFAVLIQNEYLLNYFGVAELIDLLHEGRINAACAVDGWG